jgi:hypothetical protein
MMDYDDEAGDTGDTEMAGQPEKKKLLPQEIHALLRELQEESDSMSDKEVRDIARAVEAVIADKPMGRIQSERIFGYDLARPKVTKQILDSLIQTWATMIVKDRPSVVCVPQSPSNPLNVMAAKTATAFVEFYQNEERTAEKIGMSALYAALHGTGCLKVIMDLGKNSVTVTPMTIFDVFIQNTHNKEDVKWVLFRSYVDKYDAAAQIRAVEPDYDGEPALSDYKDGAGGTRKGVEKWEIWHLPCSRFPDGLFACIIGDKIVEQFDEYPYTFEDKETGKKKSILPVIYWKCRPITGMTLGETWAAKCIPLQLSLNMLFSKSLEDSLLARQVMVLDEGMRNTDLLEGERARLFLPSGVAPDRIKYLSPAPIDPNQAKGIQDAEKALYDAAGLSPSTLGQAPSSQSGRAMAYQAELDTNKHAIAAKSLESAIQEMWELILKLVQKYMNTATQIQIAGEDVLPFTGADIQGVSVKLEQRGERESSLAVKTEKAEASVANGMAPPQTLTSINPTVATAGLKLQARKALDRLLAGEDVNIGPESMPPEIMIEEIDQRINYFYLRQDIDMVNTLTALKEQILLDASSMQQADAGPAQAEQPADAPLPESTAQEFEGQQ